MQAKDDKIFSTRDIGLATTLLTAGFPVIGVDLQIEGLRQNPIGYFTFTNTNELKDFEQEYWAGRCKIEPKSFLLNLRSLKSQIVNVQKNPHYNR